MLADIFPTGYHATEMADVQAGETVVVYGGGPVGLMAAYSATIRGAAQVFLVDRHADRLALADKIGVTPVDDSAHDPVEQVLELTAGKGAYKGFEAVGYQAHDAQGNEQPALTMNSLVSSVKATGRIGVVGILLPQDAGGPDQLSQQGQLAFDFGEFWFKGQQIGTGQANVKAYNRRLAALIEQGKAHPSFLVSHELPLDRAAEAYRSFDDRVDGWTKVLLKP